MEEIAVHENLTDQPASTPTRKMTATVLGGAVATVLAWLIGVTTGADVPPGVESAFSVIVAVTAGWSTRERAQ